MRSAGVWAVLAVAAATLALPLVLDSGGLAVYVQVAVSASVVVGISLLMGYAGQVSLGQAVFFATGGYTAALVSQAGLPTLAGLLAAPVVAALCALVLGLPLLRLRGHHLAFATIAVHLIFLAVVAQTDALGGSTGLQGIPLLSLGPVEVSTNQGYAYVAWAVLAVVVVVARNIVRSRPGRALRALATSETAAASSGIPVGRYKLTVFAVSAAFAGAAGGVFAFYIGFLSPGMFPVSMSITYVVMAVVGGLGSVWGAVAGTALVTVLVHYLGVLGTLGGMPDYAPSVLTYAVYGLVLVLTVLFLPHGVLPSLADWWRRRSGAREGRDRAGEEEREAAPA
ncbi:branched-chain amino acid ABC transporter permease [Nocardiopsis sp. NRRL B-16309]|uniref:branched-chain amino acid ABC transporter permease n=1 Tax=Nocardiopsis sp. NRRL B-16309 TaxID=1519494 RepID=UPI0006AF08B0|nr:branched-chain amino acid ABC transporter permease [Nocardiopsis sp. NRRL B-16309]KOX16334.1 inner-membrane translocator [Nocardiopsis sp. NRRL B-16309]